jgi:hypothetical protein
VSGEAGRVGQRMKIAVVVIAAYLVTGIHYVIRDLARPIISQPAYARASLSSKEIGGLMWLPATIMNLPTNARQWKFLKSSIFSLLLFLLIISVGLRF